MPRDKQWRTGVWHGDLPLSLSFPVEWEVTFLAPRTPPPLSDDQIASTLNSSEGSVPIRELARGKKRPVLVVDDPNRATPAARILPFVLGQLGDAGIAASSITIVVATGTHGAAQSETLRQKVGEEASAQCQVVVHDATAPDLVNLGKTAYGTAVQVNRDVANSDLLIGIGGIYPNHTAGFGGGTKLALGVLGFASIKHLHYRHQSLGWGANDTRSTFRQDVNEIAKMIGLNTVISTHVDAERQIVRLACGDPTRYFEDEVGFSQRTFSAPLPGDADVVVCNTYPNDLSLTFALMKGTAPLDHCRSGASRIAVAFCGEGVGSHGLFPLHRARFHRPRHIARRLRAMSFGDLSAKLRKRLHNGFGPHEGSHHAPQNPIWLFRPGDHTESLPSQIRDVRTTTSWSEVLLAVRREQPAGKRLKVVVYACAPLQCLEAQKFQSFAPQTIRTPEKKSA